MAVNENKKKHPVQSNKKLGEIYFLVILLALFALFFYEAMGDKGILSGNLGGSGTIPQLMAAAALIMIALLFVQFIKQQYKEGKILEVFKSLFTKELIGIIVMVVLYALLLEKLHFVFTTILFLFFSMILLDRKRIANKLIISVATVAVIVLIFRYIFQVILP
jgi:putative tricarboxylic transport membrane protein